MSDDDSSNQLISNSTNIAVTDDKNLLTVDMVNRPPRITIPWKKILCNGPVWALAVAKFGYYYSFFMTVTWMPTYLREMGMSEHLAAYCSAIPFAVTCPAIILFGWLAFHLVNHLNWRLVVVRKSFGTISFLFNIGCFAGLLFVKVGSPWLALSIFIVMYAGNAPFIAGVAVNVLDIAAKYAGSVMALTHEFATGAGFLASVITGALVTEKGRYEHAFMVAIGVNFLSMVVYLAFGSADPQFDTEEEKRKKKKQHHGYMLRPGASEADMQYATPSFRRICCCCCYHRQRPAAADSGSGVGVGVGVGVDAEDTQRKGGQHVQTRLPYYFPKRWIIALFAFSADFICYMDRANISATMIPMAEKYKWSKAFQGLVFGVFFLGLMSAHLVGGYLSDVYGAKNILIFGVIWWSLFTILTPPSASLQWAVILVRFLMGSGEGVNFPAVYALASEWYPEHEEHILVTIAEMGVYLGIVVAMVFVPFIEDHFGWEPVFYIFGSFGFVWAALFAVYGADSPEGAKAEKSIDEREYRFVLATRNKD